MESGSATGFDSWLRDHLHEKRWNVMDLAREMAKNEGMVPTEIETRARAISSNISKARLGKGALGDEYARKIAEALGADEISLFRAAGLLSNQPNAPAESDARRKINALIDMLAIHGPKRSKSAELKTTAQLIPENDNPHDANAVRVEISGKPVGYLDREATPRFRNYLKSQKADRAECGATIVGGWLRKGGDDEGNFGVRLDLPRTVFVTQAIQSAKGNVVGRLWRAGWLGKLIVIIVGCLALSLISGVINAITGKTPAAPKPTIVATQVAEVAPVATATIAPTLAPTLVATSATSEPSATEPPKGYLNATQFGEKWPLTVPDGVVACIEPTGARSGKVVFKANGNVYAVNGTARGARDANGWHDIGEIWADNPNIKGMKINIGPILDAGLDMCIQ